jgi:hypothetical protein
MTKSVSEVKGMVPPEIRENMKGVKHKILVLSGKGGEFFHCSDCNEHFHADVNAARNIMYVNQPKPSAVPGRTSV